MDSICTPSSSSEFWVRVENQCGEDYDTIVIQSLDDRFSSETYGALTVYNRWGRKIYQNQQHKNDWPADHEKIPAETYYLIWVNGSCHLRKGWLKKIDIKYEI